ncbi:SDR family NAD(P)-dependent oxidoreductase [Herbaspirillum rubrisubalbicans]|uniref:Oxidoreductase n=1 Tax=Herbaspirillum rubrisubalbicans TaxID=80842 RepID=A0ABX9BWX6_9BURK|nr:SDR family NAD(P)-dependent oxidoreductase [Herbaspirillum rubrisubalbicans]RAM62236.1 oxidoreductase [Herbaspirillum rubrisubalbicans]
MNTPQQPLHTGFGQHSTVSDVIGDTDLSNKVAIITGGASGIGLVTARTLAHAGATVIVGARDPEAARNALEGSSRIETGHIELLDPTSIDAFASAFLSSGRPLHFLINNAGIMAAPLMRDARGYESHLSANHLGHFQLTSRLWPALRRADGARVVTLSSGAHRQAAFDFDDPNFEQRAYDKWQAYAQSKTANVLFTVALDRRGEAERIRAFAVHPGRIESRLQRFIALEELQARGLRDEKGEIPAAQRSLYKTPEQGASTTVWCATSPILSNLGGVYCENCDIAYAVSADHKTLDGVLPWAVDAQAAERLWALSVQLTGIGV